MKGRGRGREGRKERGRKERGESERMSQWTRMGLEVNQSWSLVLCLLFWQPQFSHLWYCKTNVKIRQSTKKCLMYCTVAKKKKKGISLAFWVLPALALLNGKSSINSCWIKVLSVWPHAKSWLTGKDPDAGRDWGKEEKGTTEDETAGWHHRLDGHEFE